MEQLRIYRMKINSNVELDLNGDTPEDTSKSIGTYRVADTSNPAVLTKGMFFNNDGDLEVLDKNKVMLFSNDIKMRMAAPLAIPNLLIERNDDGKYFVYFTEKDIEEMYYRFMKNLKTTNIFQKEHTENKSDSFLFETILLDTEAKVRMAKDDYNIDVPKGSVLMIQQYTDEKSYFDAVSKGRSGLSLEGIFDLLDVTNEVSISEQKFEDQTINKKQKTNMKKVINDKFIKFEGDKVGDKVYNIEDENEKVSFETEEYKVEDGVIVEVKDEKAEDPKSDEPKETELETEVENKEDAEKAKETELETDVEDKVEDVAKETGLTEEKVLELIQPKLDEIYEALAKLKAENLTPSVQNFSAQTGSNQPQSRLKNISGSTPVKVKVENK